MKHVNLYAIRVLIVLFATGLLMFFSCNVFYVTKIRGLLGMQELWDILCTIKVFLFLAVFVPVALIMIYLKKQPLNYQQGLSNQPSIFSRKLFYISLAAFLILQIYGSCNYKLRMLADANSDLLYFSNSGGNHPVFGNLRVAYFLNMFLILPAFQFHLPLKFVAITYCINDALFHLTVSFLIILLTKRYDYASCVLLSPVLLLHMNFFYIGNALFVSGSLMVLIVAVYNTAINNQLRWSVISYASFFVIWSNPISLFFLIAFLFGLYKSWNQLCSDRWFLLFILINVVARVLSIDMYDRSRISELQNSFDFHNLLGLLTHYCISFWFLMLMTIASLFLVKKKFNNWYLYKGLVILPVLFGCCVVGRVDFNDINFSKFLYPLNLLLLVQGVPIIVKNYEHQQKTIITVSLLAILCGLITVFTFGKCISKRVRLIENLNIMCYQKDPTQSKWFVQEKWLNELDGLGSYGESMTISSYQGLPITIQVVRGDEKVKNYLYAIPNDKWFLFDSNALDIKGSLNPYYFHFVNGKYKELVLDSVKVERLKKALAE